ncbi:YceI family protein [Psychroserpens luteolus]|uniref:YceI family protein n=1 Tax=Psychroserpens luteolus TaxID=2855840 RepID=UPI001E3DECDE|nr:YceI family protein [Psychroserpens luteolus]MCD2258336.1 YceI family protein [Psychroserpens luteolus]
MKKIKITLVLLTSMVFSLMSFAQDTKTQISVDFKIRNLGFNVDGYFSSASITTNFNSNNSAQWTLSGSVKANSIATGIKKRDEHLLREDYFDVKTYPDITLKATGFKKISENKYKVEVNLTIKDVTKRITIPMQISDDDNSLKLSAYFEINRRDFGVGGSSLTLSNTARINVNYTLKKE